MWRREVIRLVLACNWIVFAISCNMAFGHGSAWRANCWQMAVEDIPLPEDKNVDTRAIGEAQTERMNSYIQRTHSLRESGRLGWWVACGVSFSTAVLLMSAFPKKPPS